MVINDGELETDLPFAPIGTPIYGISRDSNLSHLNTLILVHLTMFLTVSFVLWVPFFKDVFGPEKNAALSSGVGSDDDHPRPVIVKACWSWTTSPLAEGVVFFIAVRRCRPGVRCCSGRCGYDRGMGRKAPGP